MLTPIDQLLFNQKALKLLHEVTKGEYDNMYDKIRRDNYLGDEDMTYLNHPDDFINTDPDPMWLAFEGLLYKLPYPILVSARSQILAPKIASLTASSMMQSLFNDREANGGANAYLLPAEVFRFIYRTIAIWFSALILLVPVIVLYVHPAMSQPAVICVLVLFTIIFTACMAIHPGIKAENILIGVCAYAAVLVAFVANFQGDMAK